MVQMIQAWNLFRIQLALQLHHDTDIQSLTLMLLGLLEFYILTEFQMYMI